MQALARIAAEDPSFRVHTDTETGETIISGMGELHLEIIVDRLMREFKVDARVGKPQVAYRETITEEARAEGKFVRQSGGRGQYGHVVLVLKPLPAGDGVVFAKQDCGRRDPQRISSLRWRGASEKPRPPASWATPWWTWRSTWWTAPTTKWTPRSGPF